MSRKKLLHALEDLAKQLNVRIRYERTNAKGGLCWHNGEHQIIVDSKATDEFKIDVIANALKTFKLSDIFIAPNIREVLEYESITQEDLDTNS